MKKIFVIGGMSESGKSTVGKYLDSKGIRRLKIVTYLRGVMEEEGARGNFQEWNERNVKKNPEHHRQRFVEEFSRAITKGGIEYCCLESLYGPELGKYIREYFGRDKVVIVYVDIPLETRLARQVIRQNLSNIEEAETHLLPRDEIKKEWRVPEIKEIADVIIDNSGNIKELHQKVDEMVIKFCPELK